MLVRMRTTYAGNRGTCTPGNTIDVPDDEARALIEGRYAEAVDTPVWSRPVKIEAEIEAAVVEPPEHAAVRATRPRGRPPGRSK